MTPSYRRQHRAAASFFAKSSSKMPTEALSLAASNPYLFVNTGFRQRLLFTATAFTVFILAGNSALAQQTSSTQTESVKDSAEADQASGWAIDTADAKDKSIQQDIQQGNGIQQQVEELKLAREQAKSQNSDAEVDAQTESKIADASAGDIAKLLMPKPDKLVTPPPRVPIPTAPVLDLSETDRAQLEAQFDALQRLRDTEDAFSERLGETFFGYADALQRAGRIEEARKMFAQALHITKVNNGVNSIEQRPMLRSLFHIELARGNIEEAEEFVKRMIWVEKQHPQERDTYSFDAVRDLANEFVDRYLFRPVAGEASLILLNSASRYFRYAISRYGDQPIDQLTMPYGELAYVLYLKSKLSSQAERVTFQDPRQQRQRSFHQFERERRALPAVPRNPLGGSERFIRQYLSKAEEANDVEHGVRALLNLGDINLLFGRRQFAEQYYAEAWKLAQNLDGDHELVVSMRQPVKLPAFYYSQERPEAPKFNPEVKFPLDVSIDANGKVSKVLTDPKASETPKIAQRARRLARRLSFRPAIEGGKMVGTDQFTQDVRVLVRRSETTAGGSGE